MNNRKKSTKRNNDKFKKIYTRERALYSSISICLIFLFLIGRFIRIKNINIWLKDNGIHKFLWKLEEET